MANTIIKITDITRSNVTPNTLVLAVNPDTQHSFLTTATNLGIYLSNTLALLQSVAAFNTANASFDRANTANVNAYNAYNTANTIVSNNIISKTLLSTISTSSATAIDSNLYFTISSSDVWNFESSLIVNSSNNGIKFAIRIPSGASIKSSIYHANSINSLSILIANNTLSDIVYASSNSNTLIKISGSIINGSNSGNVFIQYAANGGAVANIVSGSYLIATKSIGV